MCSSCKCMLLAREPHVGHTVRPVLPAGAPAGWAVVSYAGKGLPPAPPPGAPGKPGGNPPAPGKPGGKGLARRADSALTACAWRLGRRWRRHAGGQLLVCHRAAPAPAWRCSSMRCAGAERLHQPHKHKKPVRYSCLPVPKREVPSNLTGVCCLAALPCTQHSSRRPSAGAQRIGYKVTQRRTMPRPGGRRPWPPGPSSAASPAAHGTRVLRMLAVNARLRLLAVGACAAYACSQWVHAPSRT